MIKHQFSTGLGICRSAGKRELDKGSITVKQSELAGQAGLAILFFLKLRDAECISVIPGFIHLALAYP